MGKFAELCEHLDVMLMTGFPSLDELRDVLFGGEYINQRERTRSPCLFLSFNSLPISPTLFTKMFQNASNPLILLVPGAWHTPRCFDIITPHFNEQGYDTRVIQLPSVGTCPGLPDMSADVALVRENVIRILDEENRDTILFMHSYGSIPGTEALKGLGKKERGESGKKTGVVALFYIAGVLPVLGGTSATTCAQVSDEERANPPAWVIKDLGDGTVENEDPILCFYDDVEPKLAQEAVTWLRPHSFGYKESLSHSAFYPMLTVIIQRFHNSTHLRCIPRHPRRISALQERQNAHISPAAAHCQGGGDTDDGDYRVCAFSVSDAARGCCQLCAEVSGKDVSVIAISSGLRMRSPSARF